MKRLTYILLLCLTAVWSWGYTDYPTTEDSFIVITRIVTSETGSLAVPIHEDAGWDYGDEDGSITEQYGGLAFEFGKPMQIEIVLSPPPPGDEWAEIRLEYYRDTITASTNWIPIRTRASGLGDIIGIPGAHLGLLWTPPEPGYYLFRVMGITAAGLYTGLPSAIGITAKGDGLSWNNHAVVGVSVQDRARPSYGTK